MKTAQQYLIDVMGYDTNSSRIDKIDALDAIQAAIDEAGSVRQQVREALADYFEDVLPEPPLPADTPPIRLGSCRKCGEARRECSNVECPSAIRAEPQKPHF